MSKDMSWSLIREGTWGTICQDEDGEWEYNKKEKSHSEKQTTINKAHAQQLKDHAWMQINRVEWNNYSCSWVVHWHCGAPAPLLGPFIAGRMGRRSDRVKKIPMPSIRLAFWLLLLFSWVVPKMYCCIAICCRQFHGNKSHAITNILAQSTHGSIKEGFSFWLT